MNALDIIVIAAVALSALIAFVRGFVKEALSIVAWAGAGLATLYGLPLARPTARHLIASPMLADIAAGLAIFIVSLILLSILTAAIAGQVKHSSLSAIDRALGLLFGIGRGILIVCLAFLALGWVVQERDWPVWMRDARTRPFLASGADFLRSLVPQGAQARGAAAAAAARQSVEQARAADQLMQRLTEPGPAPAAVTGTPPSAAPASGIAPAAPRPAHGYNADETNAMNRLIQQMQ